MVRIEMADGTTIEADDYLSATAKVRQWKLGSPLNKARAEEEAELAAAEEIDLSQPEPPSPPRQFEERSAVGLPIDDYKRALVEALARLATHPGSTDISIWVVPLDARKEVEKILAIPEADRKSYNREDKFTHKVRIAKIQLTEAEIIEDNTATAKHPNSYRWRLTQKGWKFWEVISG